MLLFVGKAEWYICGRSCKRKQFDARIERNGKKEEKQIDEQIQVCRN